jgi:ABC-type transport system involved in multi-copper enzyme maturation permease subunit
MTSSERPLLSGTPNPGYLIVARAVWLEVKRREEHLALFIFMGLYLVIAIGARLVGDTRPEAVALMLNMGLWLSASLSAILSLLTGARLIPKEIENRTLYPLLAKPITRTELLFGKTLATVVAGWTVFALFTVLTSLTWVAEFPLPGQDAIMFVQGFILQLWALVLITTLAMALSLLIPTSLAILISAAYYFAGTAMINILGSLFSETAVGGAVDFLLLYFPDFSKLCILQRFTDGAPPLPWGEFLMLNAYGLVFSLTLIAFSSMVFKRRSL